ncbi:Mycobacterial proteasome ATPase [Variovorax sp. PBS-H4]|uniref:ATP-binding protein n=1 Tax=Variovorax sp. PBS-H4 TaxID=434008 RepID=UPI001317DD7D|nr:ATP-binding protein [Variovorax sp. PBS-H4]VTU20004.1 Mycobacterial proteasome ATPase [Variovorax sp. PBS-H4]
MNHAATPCASAVEIALEHLALRLQPLRRALQLAVEEQKRLNAALTRPDLKSYCITDPHVDQLLEQIGVPPARRGYGAARRLRDDEEECEARLRARAAALGFALPLEALAAAFALDTSDVDALLACAACELHPAYARIFAFVQDDVTRQLPSVDLLCALTAETDPQWVARRRALGANGTLRRVGLLLADDTPGPELARACRLAPRALQPLTDPGCDWRDGFCDATRVSIAASLTTECFDEGPWLAEIAGAMGSGKANLVGIWGEPAAPVEDAVKAVAQAAGRPLRRWLPEMDLPQTLALTADTGSVLWVDARRLQDEAHPQLADQVAAQLECNAVPVIVSGEHAWRPTGLLAVRRYLEAVLNAPALQTCTRQWQRQLPTIDAAAAQDLAARYRMPVGEQLAVAQAARTQGEALDGRRPARLGELCRMVAQKKAGRFARAVTPRRGADDLILPESIRNQVLEIPRFYRSLPRVNESWGFGRLMSGGGLKALFTGDSGTGKTLAAEVIAHELDLPLLKIDLAQLVSKWVGETEKNIDAAFREAEACHAILFFDEADTLFGKRGEIHQSSDRYAALEVGFLLQRVESFGGLAVLASNLHDEIDPAFIRRFHVLLNFPRPQVAERLRLWARAFPADAPLHPGVDLSALAQIDLTGAGIVSVGHTAALIAADAGGDCITQEHLGAAIARQFHREARILTPVDLAKFRGAAPQAMHPHRRDGVMTASLPR